jgi:hypothetical protein
MLEKCAKSIKACSRDFVVIACGHCFPTRDLSEYIDYYLMDKQNELLTPADILEISSNDSMFHWWQTQIDGNYRTFLSRGEINSIRPSHHYAAFKNIYNGVKYAEQLGYQYAISCDADIEFSFRDLIKFKVECKNVVSGNRDGILFLSEKFGAYDSAVFFVKVETFLNMSGKISSKEDYKRLMDGEGHLLERFLVKLKEGSSNSRSLGELNDFLCFRPSGNEKEASKEYFAESKMNEPSESTLESIPILSLCTYNPVEGFYADPIWINRNFRFHKDNTDVMPKFLFFKQRGEKTCVSCSLNFVGKEGNHIIELENLATTESLLEPLDDSVTDELLKMTNIKLECSFSFTTGEILHTSFSFSNTSVLQKYLDINQILFE